MWKCTRHLERNLRPETQRARPEPNSPPGALGQVSSNPVFSAHLGYLVILAYLNGREGLQCLGAAQSEPKDPTIGWEIPEGSNF